MLAGRYTLLDASAGRELVPLCMARGVQLILAGVYNSGILATGAAPDARFDYAAGNARGARARAAHRAHLRALRRRAAGGGAAVRAGLPLRGRGGGRRAQPRRGGAERWRAAQAPIPPALWEALARGGAEPRRRCASTRTSTTGRSRTATTAGSTTRRRCDAIYRDFGPGRPRAAAGRPRASTAPCWCRPPPARPRPGGCSRWPRSRAGACAPWSAGPTSPRPTRPSASRRLAREPLLKGLRPMLQDLADPDWILGARLRPGHRRHDRARPAPRPADQAAPARRRARPSRGATRRCAMVIDHARQARHRARRLRALGRRDGALAAETPACCKLSGLATEAAPGWDAQTLRP